MLVYCVACVHQDVCKFIHVHSRVLSRFPYVHVSIFLFPSYFFSHDCMRMAGGTVSSQRGGGGRQPIQIVGSAFDVFFVFVLLVRVFFLSGLGWVEWARGDGRVMVGCAGRIHARVYTHTHTHKHTFTHVYRGNKRKCDP